ncbi:MAG TPA: hypothetical protein PKV70_05780 [Thermodesulfobacteriota bacterium]|nr:hypothetical protein [Thermodesulfobacteriota bacterium]
MYQADAIGFHEVPGAVFNGNALTMTIPGLAGDIGRRYHRSDVKLFRRRVFHRRRNPVRRVEHRRVPDPRGPGRDLLETPDTA